MKNFTLLILLSFTQSFFAPLASAAADENEHEEFQIIQPLADLVDSILRGNINRENFETQLDRLLSPPQQSYLGIFWSYVSGSSSSTTPGYHNSDLIHTIGESIVDYIEDTRLFVPEHTPNIHSNFVHREILGLQLFDYNNSLINIRSNLLNILFNRIQNSFAILASDQRYRSALNELLERSIGISRGEFRRGVEISFPLLELLTQRPELFNDDQSGVGPLLRTITALVQDPHGPHSLGDEVRQMIPNTRDSQYTLIIRNLVRTTLLHSQDSTLLDALQNGINADIVNALLPQEYREEIGSNEKVNYIIEVLNSILTVEFLNEIRNKRFPPLMKKACSTGSPSKKDKDKDEDEDGKGIKIPPPKIPTRSSSSSSPSFFGSSAKG